MPIRFHCSRCAQLLSIGKRKVGSEISCPNCGEAQVVPDAVTAAMAMADTLPSSPPPATPVPPATPPPLPPAQLSATPPDLDDGELALDGLFEDDLAGVLDGPLDTPPAAEDAAPAAVLSPSPIVRRSKDTVVLQRSTVYLQAFLTLVLLAGAFVGGYLLGQNRSGGSSLLGNSPTETADSVLIDGKLIYRTPEGEALPDVDSVVLAIPVDAVLETKFPSFGLRPQDPMPRDDHENVARIEQVGGFYTKADALGSFAIVFPREGEYRLLLISRHTNQSPAAGIDELDLDSLENFFLRPDLLIGNFRYRWTTEEISKGHGPIEFDFGVGLAPAGR